ncbi:MAG TPA: peptide chain release factor N(5)-glutamine methyltransferase [Caldisericia bacterium]|jgi:release factor glutamine methyltransferase|nr:peptide chain release factor N(5)-glutamine methyltransferase [Caldisericia bacterium]
MNLLKPYSLPGIKIKLQHNALNTLKLHDALQSGSAALKTQDARLEAEILLMKATNKDRSELYASFDEPILAEQYVTFTDFLQQRVKGRPISYITGERCFYNTTLFVDERVLIPRPETEILIEKAIEFLTPLSRVDVLDIATGSGAIAVAIGMNFPRATIDATDFSSNALDVAKMNRDRYHLKNRIHLFQSDQFDQVTKSYDLIVSNPPYIPTPILPSLSTDVQKEPLIALDGGEDGMTFIRRFIPTSRNHLKKGGMLVFEICDIISESCFDIMEECGFHDCFLVKDLAGFNRVCGGYHD